MSHIIKISSYYILNSFMKNILIIASLLLLHIVVSVMVDTLVSPSRDAGGLVADLVLVWVFALSVSTFPSSYEFLLSQGVSRKNFFIGTFTSLAIISAVGSLLVMIYFGISDQVIQTTGTLLIYEGLYHDPNLLKLALWEFAALFMLSILGWLISLIYYMSGRITRIVVSVSPVIIWIVLVSLNRILDGVISDGFREFARTILGFTSSPPNPFTGAVSLFVFAIILCVPVFILLRRSQLRN